MSFRQLTTPRAMRVLLPVGLLVAGISGWRLWDESRLLRDATEVEAVVLAADLHSGTTGTGTSRQRTYRPDVRFRYEVGGNSYESRRVTPLADSGSRAWAEELLARFPVGSKPRAFVPQGAPESAYLVRQSSWKPPVGIGAGLLIALLAGWGLVRRRREPQESSP